MRNFISKIRRISSGLITGLIICLVYILLSVIFDFGISPVSLLILFLIGLWLGIVAHFIVWILKGFVRLFRRREIKTKNPESEKWNVVLFVISSFLLVMFIRNLLPKSIGLNIPGGIEHSCPHKPPADLPSDKETCEKYSGRWGKNISGKELCNLPASDAGKECSDSCECQGSCLSMKLPSDNKTESNNRIGSYRRFAKVKGECSEWVITLGCLLYVVDGNIVQECRD